MDNQINLSKSTITKGAIAGTILLIIIIIGSSFEGVPAGYEGFEFIQYGASKGINQDIAYGEGRHFILPWNDLVIMNIQETSRRYESEVLDRNGLEVKIVCSVNYQLQKGGGGWMYSSKGMGWEDNIVNTTAYGAIKDVAGKYDAEELYSTKREKMETEILENINRRLDEYRVNLTFSEIADVDLPAIIKTDIEGKQETDQKNQLDQKMELEQT